MNGLERRLRKLEVGLLPTPETAESRRLRELILEARRRRAAREGLPMPESVLVPAFPSGMSIGETIRACAQRRRAAEEAGAAHERKVEGERCA